LKPDSKHPYFKNLCWITLETNPGNPLTEIQVPRVMESLARRIIAKPRGQASVRIRYMIDIFFESGYLPTLVDLTRGSFEINSDFLPINSKSSVAKAKDFWGFEKDVDAFCTERFRVIVAEHNKVIGKLSTAKTDKALYEFTFFGVTAIERDIELSLLKKEQKKDSKF